MQSLAKGKIHWLFTQTIEIKAFEKGQKEFTIIYLFLDLINSLSFVPSSPSRANVHEKRNLRIQGRMQILRKYVPEGFKSSGD